MTPADEAFVAFADAASPGLLRTAWLTCGDHQLAEDLVQGGWLRSISAGAGCTLTTRRHTPGGVSSTPTST